MSDERRRWEVGRRRRISERLRMRSVRREYRYCDLCDELGFSEVWGTSTLFSFYFAKFRNLSLTVRTHHIWSFVYYVSRTYSFKIFHCLRSLGRGEILLSMNIKGGLHLINKNIKLIIFFFVKWTLNKRKC